MPEADADRLWVQQGDYVVIYDGWIGLSRRTNRLPDGRLAE